MTGRSGLKSHEAWKFIVTRRRVREPESALTRTVDGRDSPEMKPTHKQFTLNRVTSNGQPPAKHLDDGDDRSKALGDSL